MHALLAKMDKKPTYPVGRVNGRTAPTSSTFGDSQSEDESAKGGVQYEQEFVQKELESYVNKPISNTQENLCNMSEVSSVVPEETFVSPSLYSRYNFNITTDIKRELPIDSFKSQILSRIEFNQVVVIEGPTGCGKTTQVPQMVMDSLRQKNKYCNIVVTQPRKIATINVTKRVCEERGWTIGTVCGYQIGLEKLTSRDEMITFMTTGVLLQKLISAKSLKQFTHIIIDEVHERNQDLDFLLLLVRKYLFTNSPNVKVILMSATINASEFAYYFRKRIANQAIPAPIIKVGKSSPYSSTIFYLDQICAMSFSGPVHCDISKPEISKDLWKIFLVLVRAFDKLPSDVDDEESVNSGSILVFLPGINEIEEANNLLLKDATNSEKPPPKLKWDIIPLHSSLPNDEQALAFKKVRPGYRKVILSTNIAESSITVPDTCFVIDFCLTKVMTVDSMTKYMSLKLEWASHVNCEQRAGRVGRTCDGRVYRLVPKSFYIDEMEKVNAPEILRAPLEHVVLHTKRLDLNDTPAQILALAMTPPDIKHIESTIWKLKEIGALLKTCRGQFVNSDGDITYLGQVMATLPIDVRLSKMIVLGNLYSCLEETLIIAAGASIQNIFSVPFQKRLDAYKKIMLWSDGSSSDLIALLNLYFVWQARKRDNAFANQKEELAWCQRNLVSLKGLREWQLLVNEIRLRLNYLDLKETVGPGKVYLTETEKPTVLKIVMAGAFYPNYFIKPSNYNQTAEREAVKLVGGRDPFCTVFFTGLNPQQPGQIYLRQIKQLIYEKGEKETDVQIGFDGSMKIYVEFKYSSTEPTLVNLDGFNRLTYTTGKIPPKIYELIKRRQLNDVFELKLLQLQKAWEFAEANGATCHTLLPVEGLATCVERFSHTADYDPLPPLNIPYIRIHISNHCDAGHFWAQKADEKTNELLSQIEEALNKQVLKQVDEQIKVGKIYAAKFVEDGLFYRCKVTAIAGQINQVLFIDYGNTQEVNPDSLYYLPQRSQCFVVPLAFECVLYGVKPAYKHHPLGIWNEKINTQFRRITDGILLYGEVYSVVNNVVELELYRSAIKENSINKYLIDQGFADNCSPSFLSKQDHERRVKIQTSSNPVQEASRLSVDKIISYTDFADPVVEGRECTHVKLKGPYSPLEIRLFGCAAQVEGKHIDVEVTSVNSVLLDSEPQNEHSRLFVAGYVGQNAEGTRLRVRQTTLMPNVPGLPALLAAIFCPTMEPKLTKDNSLVAALLCGLGFNETTSKPFYPYHDIIIRLDTELHIDELEMINKLRYLMNNGIKLMQNVQHVRSTQNELLATQIKIKDHLFKLLNMPRNPICRENVVPQNTTWGRHEGAVLLTPNMETEEQDIWPLLGFVKLVKLDAFQREVCRNLEDIENLVYNVKPFTNTVCILCQEETLFVEDLRLHIISCHHKRKVEKFKEELKIAYNDNDGDE
ncbi:hypothetical protein ABEB36_002237 [Hypothenemus hampei]|uniref:Probable ATP-dependent RNA helicase spindle-E n=1 Tax=Hypothenemus hampei TaxID=57062 RepID=A0ABD1F510_HYPHA